MSSLICHVEECGRIATYVGQVVCQMHYFRFMRNDHYGFKGARNPTDPRPKKYRLESPDGYQKIFKPGHFLSDITGYVYEHRYIYWAEIKTNPKECDLCGNEIDWWSLHIDHKDEDVRNNKPSNLRAVCRPCNVFRGHTATSLGKYMIEIDGKKMCAAAWSRINGVLVCGSTIARRKKKGYSDYECVYGGKKTHINIIPKKYNAKYDYVRGIL